MDELSAWRLQEGWTWGHSFSVISSWNTVSSVQQFSVLLGCPFPGPLALKSGLFSGFFLCLCLLASLALNLGYMWQKSQGTHCYVNQSLHLSEYSFVCFIYNVQSFQLYLVIEIGKTSTISSFWRRKSFKVILIL